MGIIATLNQSTGTVALAAQDEEIVEIDVHEAEPTEGHADEDSGSVNPVIPNVYDIVWALVFFAGLWALMKFVLLPPIVSGRDARREKTQAAKDAAVGNQDKMAAVRAEHAQKLQASQEQATAIIEQARAEVEADRKAQLAAVEAELDQQRAAVADQIAMARAQAMAGARADVDMLAVGAASSVLGRSLDVNAQRSILDRVLND